MGEKQDSQTALLIGGLVMVALVGTLIFVGRKNPTNQATRAPDTGVEVRAIAQPLPDAGVLDARIPDHLMTEEGCLEIILKEFGHWSEICHRKPLEWNPGDPDFTPPPLPPKPAFCDDNTVMGSDVFRPGVRALLIEKSSPELAEACELVWKQESFLLRDN